MAKAKDGSEDLKLLTACNLPLGQLRTDGQRDTCCCDGCRCKPKLNREMTRNSEMKKLLDHGSAPAIDFIIV
ncbi:hypothetical protein BB934_31610 (plasmid) [Microvirga ossetica]|uniref:Uncharacterized protein n=1 Tax=Microvirga ossetica TaxID=1882682 RepID=A0A1B2ES52_9HYPH|nr:hypothetical protein BB934_31610 [Microvirga ossetica]